MTKKTTSITLCFSLFLVCAVFVTGSFAADVETIGDLTVQGVIESTSGGFKFPDGSTMTAAGMNGLLFNHGFVVDNSGQNIGNLTSGAIKFGAGDGATGEGIASTRQAGPNQNGLDFYTNSTARLSIANNGYVGIGTRTPAAQLDVLSGNVVQAKFGAVPIYLMGTTGYSMLGLNLNYEYATGYRYGSNNAGGVIVADSFGLRFASAPTGTVGNTATPAWGMLLSAGKLAVGSVTTPTEALDVTGNIKASGSLTVAGGSNFSSASGTAITASAATGMAVSGTATSLGGAGIRGSNTASGEAIVGFANSTTTAAGAVVGRNDGAGYGVRGFVATDTSGNGIGVYGQVGIGGSTGRAGRFENLNAANTSNTLEVGTNGTGNAFVVDHSGSTGNIAVFSSSGNKARIDKSGKGFFNGGTQNSGADLAELFEVEGSVALYEPGDVLEISVTADRTVTRSTKPYSALVAGVFATKPGVLLTEDSIDADLSAKVPMGVVGVIPTKVCSENGPIQRGDLLVTSGKAGHAMKADLAMVKPGQVIGKALETFYGEDTGKIKVLVSVR